MAGNMEGGAAQVHCCDHSDCESIEDEEDEDEELSGDEDHSPTDEASAHQSQSLTHCNASPLWSEPSGLDTTPRPLLISRVLFHPTFEDYYTAVAIQQNLETREMQQRREEGIPANCGEYFYTDPLLSPGQRVYNCMTPESLEVFRDFRLQTPPPIMSSCIFPSSYEDDPMSDEEEALGDPSDIGGSVDPPPLQPECSPLFASPGPSNTLELEAAGALLCLSDSAPPPCGHECTGSAHLYF